MYKKMLDQFKNPLKRIKASGAYPLEKRKMVHTLVNMCSATFLGTLVVLKVIFSPDLQESELWMAFVLMTMKYLTLVQKKDVLEDLFQDLQSFWQLEYEDSKIAQLLSYKKWLTISWDIIFYIGVVVYWIKPIFLKGSSIFFCYLPTRIPFLFIYSVEVYYIYMTANAYIGFNLMIATFIILITIQFRQINLGLERLKMENIRSEEDWQACQKTIKRCIEHHTFLRRVVSDLNDILYIAVGFLIGATTLLMCLHMYVLLTIDLTSAEVARLLLTFSALMFEFMLGYGLPSQMLMDEAENMTNTLYSNCSWYLAPAPIKKIILLMLMRSQMVVCISVKNLVIVNNQTFLMMVKTAYSFYTFLRTMT